MVRNPTRPTTSPSTVTSWSRGVPWVCGHQSSTSGSSTRCPPASSTTPVVSSSRADTIGPTVRPVTSVTGWCGPTTGGPGEKPGARPRSWVRTQRSRASSTSIVRHRCRGLVGSVSSSSVRGCTTMRTSWSPAATGTSCRSNIDRPDRTTSPSTSRSQTVAMPPTSRTPGPSAVHCATYSWVIASASGPGSGVSRSNSRT